MKFPKSYWIDSTEDTNYPALEKDITIDIAIVGGGIAGITCALLLQKNGFKTAIFEGRKIAQGASGYTTAKITSQHNLIYEYLIKSFGLEKAQQYADINEKSIKFIKNTIEKYDIDCDFEMLPSYVYTLNEEYISKIENEVEACKKLGLNVQYKEKINLSLPIKASIEFQNQAQFHPRKYLLALANEFINLGGRIYEDTRIVDLEKGTHIILSSDKRFKIEASKVVLASHFPCYDGFGFYFSRLRPERSYIIGVESKKDFPTGMFINAEDPRRSLRCQRYKNGELILIGGENHKTGEGEETISHYENLNKFASSIFTIEKELYRWSTQDYITLDKVPYIGKLSSSSNNIYVATGFGKWGMSSGTSSALILKDLILNEKSPYEDIFNPSRFDLSSSIKNFIIDNLDTSKELIKGKIKKGEENLILNLDEGRIVEIEGHKYGAYKDVDGKLYVVDNTCTHLGCQLQWNAAERTWDCPCHGSRFNYKGEIIEGPALKPLNQFNEKEELM